MKPPKISSILVVSAKPAILVATRIIGESIVGHGFLVQLTLKKVDTKEKRFGRVIPIIAAFKMSLEFITLKRRSFAHLVHHQSISRRPESNPLDPRAPRVNLISQHWYVV